MDNARFDNGVPISPVMVQIYESLPGDKAKEWGGVSSSAYYHWLNAPADSDASGDPPISNLAAWLYHKRVDLRETFPGLTPTTRVAFFQWYLVHAQREYHLDEEFVTPMRDAVLAWARRRSPADPMGAAGVPMVTNLGAYLHATQTKLQKLFPDIYGRNRVDFAVWYLYHVQLERCTQRDLILPVVLSWAEATVAKLET
jgi:hypothetical protein